MITHTTTFRVRYAETDQMGFAYHGNYPAYYELGRTELMRSFGLSYSEMEAQGILMPVLELHSTFIKSAYYDNEITIKTIINQMPSAKIHFNYELYNSADELINKGKTVLAFLNKTTYRPTRPPKYFIDAVRPYFS